ncbi:Imm32 family immunity protein [Deinococcus arcticus]|uniref:Imm32 family immunity protein n=1 Tax=Deinococcus arcticus TaxID=2136176 RepID=UPI003FA4C543
MGLSVRAGCRRKGGHALRSLARLLLGLTVDGVQAWHHWHLEDWNSLEEGSAPLTVMKFPEQL